MFKLFSRKKDPNSKAYRWEMARQMANHHIRYVTEKRNGVDEVIGRNGGLNIRDDELIVFASSDVELLFYNVLIDQCLAPSSDHNPIYVDVKLKK